MFSSLLTGHEKGNDSVDSYPNVDFRRLTQAQCAAMHGTDPRTIRRWTHLGMPRNADETYSAAVTIRWRAEHTTSDGRVEVYRVGWHG